MKKYIFLNLTGLFVFFLFTCILISCGKSGKAKPEASNPPPAKPKPAVGPKATKFTPAMVMAAIEIVAKKLPEEDREDFLDDSPLEGLYEATEDINKDVARGRLKVSEISSEALGEAIYEEIFGKRGGSAGARARANRIKCVNNLKHIGTALLTFSQDNAGRTPWNLLPVQKKNHFGDNYAQAVGSMLGIAAMKAELQTPKILISPCDKGRVAANEVLQGTWARVNTKAGNPINPAALSYGLCLGGDFQRPATVIATTRNLSTDDLATALWLGAAGPEDPLGDADQAERVISGLSWSQGQMVMADGSARQSNDADLGATGKIIKGHINAAGGTSPLGPSSTKMMLPY